MLGQNISTAINSYLLSGNAMNAEVIASSADRDAVAQQLAHTAGIKHLVVASTTLAMPVTVNGQPVGDFVRERQPQAARTRLTRSSA